MCLTLVWACSWCYGAIKLYINVKIEALRNIRALGGWIWSLGRFSAWKLFEWEMSLDGLAESMSWLDELVRVCPEELNHVITRRVRGQLAELSCTFTRLLRKWVDSTSQKGALGESGQTWTVDMSLSLVDYRVGLTMSNGDHGGVKWSFIRFKS